MDAEGALVTTETAQVASNLLLSMALGFLEMTRAAEGVGARATTEIATGTQTGIETETKTPAMT
jgi:hypothetical protein